MVRLPHSELCLHGSELCRVLVLQASMKSAEVVACFDGHANRQDKAF